LRFSIISITSQGQDVFLSRDKFELGRNFANKLWNASRYVLMNLEGSAPGGGIDKGKLTLADRWILSSLNRTVEKVTRSLEVYRFSDAASALYDFIWHKYCDWYLEISKLSDDKETTRKVLVKVLAGALRLLHPFMPFITEEIWQKIPGTPARWIMTADWPEADKEHDDAEALGNMEKLIGIITAVRNVRAFWNIGHDVRMGILLSAGSREDQRLLEENTLYIERLARCEISALGKDVSRPDQSVAALIGGVKLFIPLGGTVDVEKEKARIAKKMEDLERYLGGIDKKLANKSFLDKAPEDVVRKEKAKRDRFREQVENLKENLAAIE